MEMLCFEGNYIKRFARYKKFCHEQAEVALGEFMKRFCNSWLEEEYTIQSGAEKYERGEGRRDYRGGHYERELITSRGIVKVKVPRGLQRKYSYSLFEKYQRRTVEFDDVVVSALLNGHSSRKAQVFFKRLLGEGTISHQTAVKTLRRFDSEVKQWKHSAIRDEAVILVLDAVYFKGVVRHLKTAKPVLFGYAVYPNGQEEVVGFELAQGESVEAWYRFCLGLQERGLKNVQLIVRDDCAAIKEAISLVWPKALEQSCVFHIMQNFTKKLNGCKDKKDIIRDVSRLYEAQSEEEFYRRVAQFKVKWQRYQYHEAMKYLLKEMGKSIKYFSLPQEFWRVAKTTNRLERLFEELKRRIRVFRRFPNNLSCERWLYALLKLHHKINLNSIALQSQHNS
jgi:transposase-like protein